MFQKYPKTVWLIILNEFCERFSYYGLRSNIHQTCIYSLIIILLTIVTFYFTAILMLYLTTILKFNGDESTIIYHSFVFLAYLMPLPGAILADSYWGRYKYGIVSNHTIIHSSIIMSYHKKTFYLEQ